MPWQLPQTTTQTGTVVALGTTDDVLVSTEVTLTSTGAGSPTILGFGSNHEVVVYGKVVDDMDSAIVLGDSSSADSGNKVSIAQTGQVFGLDAVVIAGIGTQLVNDGLIKGTGFGIVLDGEGTGSTITNNGLIVGGTAAISRGPSDASQTITLINNGTIFGNYVGSTLTDIVAIDIVTNTGLVIGDIKLGAGNDTYDAKAGSGRVDGIVYGGAGVDTLRGGAEADTLYGDAGNDLLFGWAGDDVLYGGTGVDQMRGGVGNDTYRVFDAGDVIVEAQAEGAADKVVAAVSYRLHPNAPADIEIMQTNSSTSTKAIDLAGNAYAQTLIGNAGANRLEGREGNDTLRGLGGNDTFAFATGDTSDNIDTIVDFNPADDRMLFHTAFFGAGLPKGAISADRLRINTTGLAEDADDRFIYNITDGSLYHDRDGLGGTAGQQFAVITAGLTLTNLDFVMA